MTICISTSSLRRIMILKSILCFFCLGTVFQAAVAQDVRTISTALSVRITASGRKTIAVIDFTDLQGNVTELGRFLAEELSVNLLADAKGFEVIDRTHLKSIMQENKLSSTGLIDPQTARKLGLITGVDALVTGTITPLGDSVRLSAKVLDTVSAKMIAASTGDIPRTKAIEDLLGRGVGSYQATGSTGADAPAPGASTNTGKVFTVEDNAILLVLKACWRSGRMVLCSGSVANRAEKRRGVAFGWSSNAVDDLGNQYQIPDGKLSMGSGGIRQDLEPDLPVNFSFSIDDVNPAARLLNVVLGYGADEGGRASPGFGGAKAVFRQVPIVRK